MKEGNTKQIFGILLGVVLFASLVSGFSFFDWKSFFGASAKDAQLSPGECSDSDGGLNYNIRGEVYLDKKKVDSCLSTTMLKEYYCKDGKSSTVISSVDYKCPNGCVNGACKPVSECEYVHYKDVDFKGNPYSGSTFNDVCNSKGLIPKVSFESIQKTLYNHLDCSISYSIYASSEDSLQPMIHPDIETLGPQNIGGVPSATICYNNHFPDGSFNANFSYSSFAINSWVVCCSTLN